MMRSVKCISLVIYERFTVQKMEFLETSDIVMLEILVIVDRWSPGRVMTLSL